VSSDETATPDASRDVSSEAAERFAGALDGGGAAPDDPDLAREVALARQLGALGPSLDPDPDARERARQRLLAALAHEVPPGDAASGGPSRAS
jgi:hypothetical protein